MRGFSLLELMIAAAIAAILAAAALPSYRGHLLRAHRAVAKSVLLDIASRQEAYLLQHRRYASGLSEWYPADARGEVSFLRDGTAEATASTAATYRVRLAADATSFVLDAQPVNAQALDSGCGTLRYDSAGGRGASGPQGPDCWR